MPGALYYHAPSGKPILVYLTHILNCSVQLADGCTVKLLLVTLTHAPWLHSYKPKPGRHMHVYD